MTKNRINHMFVDIENSLGIRPNAALNFFEEHYGNVSQRRSFLSEQNWNTYRDDWVKASFSVERCGDGPDAADLRLINAIVQTISEPQSHHHIPGTLCIVTNGDKIYRHIIQLAKKQGWSVVVLSWGQLRGPLSKYIDAHHNLRAIA